MAAGFAQRLKVRRNKGLPVHGWIGLVLLAVSWYLNWELDGLRTHWAFFPLWLGYCWLVDGITAWRTGTSLMYRNPRRYMGLYIISAPAWWLFELLNLRTQNWIYLGVEQFTPAAYAFWTTLNFSTVLPAVFGTAELCSSLGFVRLLPKGPIITPDRRTTILFFIAGWLSLALLLVWPRIFFPLLWISLYCVLEPLNVWLGNPSLADWTKVGDWRPVIALWLGVVLTAFFWELWNFRSFPKWVYDVPWADALHVFEMPLLGYGGYLPFALELFALYHLVLRILGLRPADYLRLDPGIDRGE